MKTFCNVLIPTVMILMTTAGPSPVALAKPNPQVKTDPQVVAKLAQTLEQSGYPYKKAADNVWVVSFKGKSLADISVLVTSVEDIVVMAGIVAEKSSMKVTPDMMLKLLRVVNHIDRVKIGFDEDEDLFVRAEVNSKCLDVAEFKSYMTQVSAGVDQVHAAIKSHLVK